MNAIPETNPDTNAIRAKLHQLFAMVGQHDTARIEASIDTMFAEDFPAVDAVRQMLSLEKRMGKEFDLARLHDVSYKNGDAVRASTTPCGCFDCCNIFPSSEIRDGDLQAEEDGTKTVFCPYCCDDSIINRCVTDYPIDKESLTILHKLFCSELPM